MLSEEEEDEEYNPAEIENEGAIWDEDENIRSQISEPEEESAEVEMSEEPSKEKTAEVKSVAKSETDSVNADDILAQR